MTPVQNWGAWDTWTPAVTGSTTDPDLGSGATIRGRYQAQGTEVRWAVRIVVGTSPNNGSGRYQSDVMGALTRQ